MYTGTMIEDLIQAVAHAEEQAQVRAQAQAQVPPQILRPPVPAPPTLRLHYEQAYVAPMVGVA